MANQNVRVPLGQLGVRKITYWLSLVMIFVIPWENVVTISGAGTISRTAGLLVAAFWILSVVSSGKLRKPLPFHVAVFLFVLWNATSVFWSVNVDATLVRSRTYLQLSAMVMILWDLFTTPSALRAGFQAYVLGAYVSVGSVIFNYQSNVEFSTQRFSAAGFNPNYASLIFALAMPLAWYLAVLDEPSRASRLRRLLNYCYPPAALFAILLTSSRSGFLATVPAFLFMFASLTSVKTHVRVLALVALVACLLALRPLIPESSVERVASTGNAIAEGDNRVRIWREGFDVFSKHPILGVGSGSGAFRAAMVESRTVSHNFALGLLTQIGIIGFGLFVVIFAVAFQYVRFLPKWSSRLWLTMLIIWLMNAVTHNPEHTKQTWLFLSLAVVNAGLFVRGRKTGEIATLPRDSP